MPYVKQEKRPALDEVVDELVRANLRSRDLELFLMYVAAGESVFPGKYSIPYHLGGRKPLFKAIKKAFEVDIKPNGDVNYVLFKYCKYYIKPSYNNYKAFMGEIYNAMESISTGKFKNEIREAAEWIRIKLLTLYEEKAMERNGDV